MPNKMVRVAFKLLHLLYAADTRVVGFVAGRRCHRGVGVLGGFGASSFFVPVATWFYDFQTELVLTGLLHVFCNADKLVLFRKHINRRLFLLFAVSAIVLVVLGAWLSAHRASLVYPLLLGVLLAMLSGVLLLWPPHQAAAHHGSGPCGWRGVGLCNGPAGHGRRHPRPHDGGLRPGEAHFCGHLASVTGLLTDTSRTAVYLYQGYLCPKHYVLVPVQFVGAWLGAYTGKKVLGHVSQQRFRQMNLVLVLGMGISLMASYFR